MRLGALQKHAGGHDDDDDDDDAGLPLPSLDAASVVSPPINA